MFAFNRLSDEGNSPNSKKKVTEETTTTLEVNSTKTFSGEPEIISEISPNISINTAEIIPPPAAVQKVFLSANEPTQSAIAREALSFVGVNPAAERVWLDVINNPETPAKDRKNLIEDLDRDGFQNRRSPTADDLALIQNRLAIIEKYAPSTTDPINSAAFQEAKKDLSRMLKKATTPIQ